MPTLPKIGEEVTAANAPLEVRPELPPIGGEVGQARTPDFRATNEPPSTSLKAAAYGKDALQLALDALPGAGMVVGGAMATPGTLGLGTVAGAALGAGTGRGLRDLISAGLGLERPKTAMAEGGRIAMDTAETAVASVVLPWLWQTIKAPGARVGDVVEAAQTAYELMPKAVKAVVPNFRTLFPKGLLKAPAAILERPAWQTWQEHLPDAQPSPQVARTTGTSMIPAAVPAPSPAPVPPPAAAPMAVPPVSIDTAPAATEFQAAQAARQALPDQRALNEAAIAKRRAAYAASQASTPAADIIKASGKMRLTAEEWTEFQKLLKAGKSPQQAFDGAKLASELAARLGGASPVEVAKAIAQRKSMGKW